MYKEEYTKDSSGILAIKNVLCDEMSYPVELVKNLIVKYPGILCKSEEQMREYFAVMKNYGVGREKAMKNLLEAPRLISFDLEKQIKD